MLDETGLTKVVNFATINDSIFISIDNRFAGENDPNNNSTGYFNPSGDDANMDFSADQTFENNDIDDNIDDLFEESGD